MNYSDEETVYTKTEVDRLIATAKWEAIEEAREIDRDSMAKHTWDATIISMILGFLCLALFLDGLLRILGIVPPFMDLDVSIIDDVAERVKTDIIPYITNNLPGI